MSDSELTESEDKQGGFTGCCIFTTCVVIFLVLCAILIPIIVCLHKDKDNGGSPTPPTPPSGKTRAERAPLCATDFNAIAKDLGLSESVTKDDVLNFWTGSDGATFKAAIDKAVTAVDAMKKECQKSPNYDKMAAADITKQAAACAGTDVMKFMQIDAKSVAEYWANETSVAGITIAEKLNKVKADQQKTMGDCEDPQK